MHTENICTLSLGPITKREPVRVVIDDHQFESMNLNHLRQFQRNDESVWVHGKFDLSDEKRHQVSGPISNLFLMGLSLVPGTVGTEEDIFFNDWMAKSGVGYYRSRNDGVHRGSIMGTNAVKLAVIPDIDLSDDLLQANNLLLYDTYESNTILARLKGLLPLAFEERTIHLFDKSYMANNVTVFAVFPHPENLEHYVVVHEGVTPDAISWGSHLDVQLLPDYIVYSGEQLLD